MVVLIHPKFFSRAIFVNNLHIPPHTQLSPHSIQHQEDLTKRSPKKFSNKIMFFVVESPIELFMSTHWRTCLRYKVGIKWQNFVNTFYKNGFGFYGKSYNITNNQLKYYINIFDSPKQYLILLCVIIFESWYEVFPKNGWGQTRKNNIQMQVEVVYSF